MKNKVFLLIMLSFSILMESCSTFMTGEKATDFIRVKNGKFYKGEKPYYFTGTNLWYGCYIGSSGETGDRERLIMELDKLKSLHIENLRVLAASEESTIKRSIKPAVQTALGVLNEDLLDGLDYLLYEMGKRDMRAVIFLNNYWEWSGGMGQYNAWTQGGDPLDLGDPDVGWQNWNNYVSFFYRNEEANKYFRDFIKKLITRKNKYSGLYYYEDPAIMTWQLANEPRPGNGADGIKNISYFYTWVDETAGYIHSLAPNHLVTTGSEGTWGSLGSDEIYLKTHSFDNIDYMTFHLWPKNWSWFDANRIEETYGRTVTNAKEYIIKHIGLARKLNKPITLEEFGLPRDFEYNLRGTLTTARDNYFKEIYQMIYDSAAIGAPIAGSNFWTWGGDGSRIHPDAVWRIGDPFTGDPPQEPQGLNSIFNTDYSTLKVINDHARSMGSLMPKK